MLNIFLPVNFKYAGLAVIRKKKNKNQNKLLK